MKSFHEHYMARACELALQGLNTTTPNPRVGCVLVKRDVELGEGFHERAGQPHAEINALHQAGEQARGATVYVTLEPCSHTGKTGPCADALINAGVSHVVYGMEDPNPQVAGRGLARLRAAGIEVTGPVLENEARALNPGFIKRMSKGRPYVRLKLAMSMDGRTAMANGESKWITSGHARQDVQRLRARSCAIVTGVATVLADDPAMTVRDPDLGANPRQPLRVVVDSRLRTPHDAQILMGGQAAIATCALARPGLYPVPVWQLPANLGNVDLPALLDKLGEQQCNEVLVEAGSVLAGAFVVMGLVDELVLYAAPKFLGSDARALLTMPLANLSDAVEFDIAEAASVGPDLRLVLKPKH